MNERTNGWMSEWLSAMLARIRLAQTKEFLSLAVDLAVLDSNSNLSAPIARPVANLCLCMFAASLLPYRTDRPAE